VTPLQQLGKGKESKGQKNYSGAGNTIKELTASHRK
jgi:hypothetical protein